MERSATLRLYRQLLKSAGQFEDYNFRHYAVRSTKNRFREGRSVKDVAAATALAVEGTNQLALLRRQVIVGRLYAANRVLLDAAAKTAA